ncbi:protein disulfide-isomerase [[Candida] anglica]|uniref:protein disulfide-isomerase n=1 Tax=[Candida] anglica TaxID=148631 RepID=A0ABP0EBV3_9ASCO
MQFWKYSVPVLATLLAAVSASGPADGDAIADPNSAVVKLTSADYESFIAENPLILAEFFAPWCGYCKVLGPEFSKAADVLEVSHPSIKLAQIDCTEEEKLCAEKGIKGYPTLKIINSGVESDYEGPREADGITKFMIEQTLPVVAEPATVKEFDEVIAAQEKAFIVQVIPPKFEDATYNSTFAEVANIKRKDLKFISISSKNLIKDLDAKLEYKFKLPKITKPEYFLIRPNEFADAVNLESTTFEKDSLINFIETESVPYFGDINRDTYMLYMNSPLPIGYFFYNSPEEREAVNAVFNKLGKAHRGKINFVGLDATLFGRHAEVLNMDPEIVPFFAIQQIAENKKYGLSQSEFPTGPSTDAIEKFVEDFFADKLEPIVKSEPLPTPEEIAASPVRKLVTYNHDEIVKNEDKDVFVKYYAPWCGHCKTLAPKWEELGAIMGSNQEDADVIIADVDHTANDVTTPFQIEGYPTLVLYPAHAEVDEKTGFKKHVLFEGMREVEQLLNFLQLNTGNKIDGQALKAKFEAEQALAAEADEEEVEEAAEAEPAAEDVHDEL